MDTLIFGSCKVTQKTDKILSACVIFLLKNKYSDPVSAFISIYFIYLHYRFVTINYYIFYQT